MCGFLPVRTVARRDDPNQRIDVHEACVREILANGLARGDIGAREDAGKAAAIVTRLAERGTPGPLAAHVAPEGRLGDRGDAERAVVAPLGDVARRSSGVGCEPRDELVRVAEWVEVVRVAVVANVPDRQDVMAALRGQEA